MQTALDLDLIVRTTGLSVDEVLNSEQIIVNAFDHQHITLFWNRGAAVYFGISPDDAIGKKQEDIIPEARGHERTNWIDRCLRGQEMHLLNGEYTRRRGKYEQKIIPAKDGDGKICAAVNVVIPII